MKKPGYLWLAVALLLVSGCASKPADHGTLSGHVTIGPLVPVVRQGEPEPTPSPEHYAAWKIVIYSEDMQDEIARVDISPKGDYEVALPVGKYNVTAEPANGPGGVGGSQVYPVQIFKDSPTRQDVDIDTGIR